MRTFLKKHARALGTAAVLVSSLSLTACEMPQFVSTVHVKSFETAGHVYGEVATTVNMQGMILPQLNFPVKHPQNPNVVVGHLKSEQVPGNPSTSIVTVTLDLTEVASLTTTGPALLPNGAIVPVTGYSPDDVLEFTAIESVKVYFSLDTANRQAMIGAAIPVEQLDWIGGSMGEANLFHEFNFSNVSGVVGAFTGALQGQSGLGLFIDISSIMGSTEVQNALANNALERNQRAARHAGSLGAKTNTLSSDKETALKNELIKLSNSGMELIVR